MMTFIAIIHIVVALALIGLVLIQDTKGGGALGMGGGSNSVLGATGAQTLASKMTAGAAIIFALTCIGLSVLTAQQTKSVIDSMPAAAAVPAPQTAPANPADATATQAPAANTAAPVAPAETAPQQQGK